MHIDVHVDNLLYSFNFLINTIDIFKYKSCLNFFSFSFYIFCGMVVFEMVTGLKCIKVS